MSVMQYISNAIMGRKKAYDGKIELDELTNILRTVNPKSVRLEFQYSNHSENLDEIMAGKGAAALLDMEFKLPEDVSLNWKFFSEGGSIIRGKHYFTIQTKQMQKVAGKYGMSLQPVKKATITYVA